MTFRVGQKVVCIQECVPCYGAIGPVKGVVYTIRDFVEWHGVLGIRVQEIRNVPWNTDIGLAEVGFRIVQFRPVVEPKTDISIFTAMLRPTKVDA